MNDQPLNRYRILMSRLLFERAAAGGELREDEESSYVALLDEVWWQLSSSEQDQVEKDLKEVRVQVAHALNLVDLEVAEGEKSPPRRAA